MFRLILGRIMNLPVLLCIVSYNMQSHISKFCPLRFPEVPHHTFFPLSALTLFHRQHPSFRHLHISLRSKLPFHCSLFLSGYRCSLLRFPDWKRLPILLGILGVKDQWIVESNKEMGEGYGDIVIETENGETGIIIEIKYARDGKLDFACERAIEQISVKKYDERFKENGIRKILKYGIACYKKQCKVQVER